MEFKGDIVIQGKTKIVYDYNNKEFPNAVIIESKDRITAFNEKKANTMEGKAVISNNLNAMVFKLLEKSGIKTSFVKKLDEERFYVSKKCHMIPIEWVTRRIATGSFLKRNPGVKEGYRFTPLKIETFLKDDANDDPQLSMEQILASEMKLGDRLVSRFEYDVMFKQTQLVFEVLEKAWATLDCVLVDMKIEFGFDVETGDIILSDVIDNDSWRLWPSGDKKQMKDKQVYRDLEKVDESALKKVKANFQWVVDKFEQMDVENKGMVVIVMGSPSDMEFAKKIKCCCQKFNLKVVLRVCSAHKATSDVLQLISQYESMLDPVVYIAVAGRSNGLGPVISANSTHPVINCPPLKEGDKPLDIWSSINTPSGLGCSTVLYPDAAAHCSASILAQTNFLVWALLKTEKFELWHKLVLCDNNLNKQ